MKMVLKEGYVHVFVICVLNINKSKFSESCCIMVSHLKLSHSACSLTDLPTSISLYIRKLFYTPLITELTDIRLSSTSLLSFKHNQIFK